MQQAGAWGKTIHPNAYNALADALSAVFWNKKPFELYVRGMLRDQSELLVRLDFQATKREVSSQLVNLLRANESRYFGVTIRLMIDLAEMDRFPNLEQQVDRDDQVAKAVAAVNELRQWTAGQQEAIKEHRASADLIAQRVAQAEQGRLFAEDHERLKRKFLDMHSMADPQRRGKDFEKFINELFGLYDLEPRADYSLAYEQVDGAFYFETDHYVLEAKWLKERVGRRELDVFKANVERKSRNTLGLYVSMSGFTVDALAVYSFSTPFITMDGGDFMAVLDQRIRLEDLLKRKRAHAGQTGQCYLPASEILAQAD